jgi:hypothetical protein
MNIFFNDIDTSSHLSLKLECLSIAKLSLLAYIYECGWSLPKQHTLLQLRMDFSLTQKY